MNLTYSCPQCERATRSDVTTSEQPVICNACGHELPLPQGLDCEEVDQCLVCGGSELFIRKDFNQRLGLFCIFAGIVASSVTYFLHMRFATYGILAATAAVDFLLYYCVGNLLECYRCHAEYRGLVGLDGHNHFDLEVHERYRQQAARLAEASAETQTEVGS